MQKFLFAKNTAYNLHFIIIIIFHFDKHMLQSQLRNWTALTFAVSKVVHISSRAFAVLGYL